MEQNFLLIRVENKLGWDVFTLNISQKLTTNSLLRGHQIIKKKNLPRVNSFQNSLVFENWFDGSKVI